MAAILEACEQRTGCDCQICQTTLHLFAERLSIASFTFNCNLVFPCICKMERAAPTKVRSGKNGENNCHDGNMFVKCIDSEILRMIFCFRRHRTDVHCGSQSSSSLEMGWPEGGIWTMGNNLRLWPTTIVGMKAKIRLMLRLLRRS